MTGKPKRTLHYFIAIGVALVVGLTLATFMRKGLQISAAERKAIYSTYSLPAKTGEDVLNATRLLHAQLLGASSVASVRHVAHVIPDFQLVDMNGQPFTKENLRGQWHLLFTGFTHCPDICPPTLNVMEQVDEALKQAGAKRPRLLFVSVDPHRDTPANLKQYLSDRDILGVTGEEAQLKQLVQRGLFFPFAAQVKANENYSVTHNGGVALINPEGNFIAFFPQSPPRTLDVALITRDLQRLIR